MPRIAIGTAVAVLALALLAGAVWAKTITGTTRDDTLLGTPAADALYGKGGNDKLYGLAGTDRLDGGPANDVLVGGPGLTRSTAAAGAIRRGLMRETGLPRTARS